MIAFVVAHDQNHVIGYQNQLPWHIPEDLAYFKEVTLGKPIVMGRNTFESIGRPLPGRENIVVTRNKDYYYPGIIVKHSIEDAVQYAKSLHEDVMIIGGAEIFKNHLDVADTLFITEIFDEFQGDTYFPQYADWELVWSSEKQTSRNGYTFVYKRYEKRGK